MQTSMDTDDNTSAPRRESNTELPVATSGLTEECNAPLPTPTSKEQVTPPRTRAAIDELVRCKFDPHHEEEQTESSEETAAAALLMFGQAAIPAELLPKLRTEKWNHTRKKPNPISVGTAKKLFAAACVQVPCTANKAGVHWHAWMIEDENMWLKGEGVSRVQPPTKPKEIQVFDMKAQWELMLEERRHMLHKHLVQKSKLELTEWFGKEMFLDPQVDGLLPTTTTPGESIEHSTATHSSCGNRRQHMEEIEAEFNGPCDKSPLKLIL